MNIAEVDKLKSLIEGIPTSMLVTHSLDGGIVSRPMATLKVDDRGDLWFFTDITSKKSTEIEINSQVNLTFVSQSDATYVSVSGKGDFIEDDNMKKELFNRMSKAWYPEGSSDPKLSLLRVKPQRIEYWDGTSNGMKRAFEAAHTYITGRNKFEAEHDVM